MPSPTGLKNLANPLLPVMFTDTQHVVPNIPREDSQTEERIAQILNDAQQAMQIKKEVEQVSSLENYVR